MADHNFAIDGNAMNREEYEREKATNNYRAFLEAIEPLHKMMVNVYASAVPKIIVHPDGHTEQEWPAWVKDAAAIIDEQVKLTAKHFGYEDNSVIDRNAFKEKP